MTAEAEESIPDSDVTTAEPVIYRAEVLCQGFLLTLASAVGEEQFIDALLLLYCRDNRRGRASGTLDLYALFAEIDWPEGYYYCMHDDVELRRLHRDLLRLPHNGMRYRAGRWKSRGYSPKKLDMQAGLAREIVDGAS